VRPKSLLGDQVVLVSDAGECGAPRYRVLLAGDTALTIELGDGIDQHVSATVLALGHRINERRLHGLVETLPTLRSLMVYYDPLKLPTTSLLAHIDELMRGLKATEQPGRVWKLPVCYHPTVAPDLEHVAARSSLAPAQVIERHGAVTYHVYMLGFLPGQAYMGDVPPELALPRRETPRQRVAAGSVAIATALTCIFPLETPCGWHVIGRSPAPLWQTRPSPRALLAPGDKVTFQPISLREYEAHLGKAAEGAPRVPWGAPTGAAA
jgi:KipI family sensor histidine kinase inhibitor